jgi:hypothetical protein
MGLTAFREPMFFMRNKTSVAGWEAIWGGCINKPRFAYEGYQSKVKRLDLAGF